MKRLLALILALVCLTSCASMLEREETYTAEHVENPVAGGDTGYRVNTYLGLCSALRSYVEEGMAEGNLRFPATYPGNLTVDLEKAKRYLMEETAVGCYTLHDVTFHVSRIVAYYEVTAAFDYRVDPAEYRALEVVYSNSYRALNEHFQEALENFGGSFTVRLEDCPLEDDYDLVAWRLRDIYDGSPELAVAYPDLEVTYYPENGAQRVAEVKVTYPESVTTLRLRQRDMLRSAKELAAELDDPVEPAADNGESWFRFNMAAYDLVMERFQYDPEGGGTAADALQDGAATDEGLARLWQLLCRLKGVEHTIFGPQGGLQGYETVIALPEGGATMLSFKPSADQGGETP